MSPIRAVPQADVNGLSKQAGFNSSGACMLPFFGRLGR
jgi:hypothetical protein